MVRHNKNKDMVKMVVVVFLVMEIDTLVVEVEVEEIFQQLLLQELDVVVVMV